MENLPETEYWKKIELFLNGKRGVNVYEVARHLDIHWATTEKELIKLENLGRVHSEVVSKTKVYFLNGVGNFQEKFVLGKNHYLFIDTFVSPFGERFARLKETKKIGNDWKNIGNVIVTKDVLKNVSEFLGKISNKIN